MKKILFSTALLAVATISGFAGTDSAPTSNDSKDMKDTKQIAPPPSDAGFYVGAYGGAQFDTNYGDNRQTISGAGGATTSTNADINSKWGEVGGVKFGYNFQSHPLANFMSLRIQPAVEAEALYIGQNNSNTAHNFTGGRNENFSTNSGDFFINGILRFKNSSIVTPYIGAGVGLQYFTMNGDIRTVGGGNITGLNGSDLDFAGQALFGLDVAITHNITLFSEYKWIDAIGTDAKSSLAGGATYRFKPDELQQNLITAGVKYSF